MLTKLINCICILGMTMAINGCVSAGTIKPHFKTWQEEVKFNDGRVIVVTQKRRCDAAYPSICLERESWLTFNLPELSGVPINWTQRLAPTVLNVHQGKLYVVGMPPTEWEFKQYDRPRPPYLGYRFESGLWIAIPFSEIPVEIYDTNLVIDADKVKTKLLTIKIRDSEELNGSPGYPRPVKRIDPNFKW